MFYTAVRCPPLLDGHVDNDPAPASERLGLQFGRTLARRFQAEGGIKRGAHQGVIEFHRLVELVDQLLPARCALDNPVSDITLASLQVTSSLCMSREQREMRIDLQGGNLLKGQAARSSGQAIVAALLNRLGGTYSSRNQGHLRRSKINRIHVTTVRTRGARRALS